MASAGHLEQATMAIEILRRPAGMNSRLFAFGIAGMLLVVILCCKVVLPTGAAEPTVVDDAAKARLVRELKVAWRAALEAEGTSDHDKAIERLDRVVAIERQLGLDPSDPFATSSAARVASAASEGAITCRIGRSKRTANA